MHPYYGDLALGTTHDFKFNTAANGVPTTLAGSPVISAYVGNGTTEITAGITLAVDIDGRIGLHNIRVVATSGNGYATGTDVDLVITVGTVGGSTVVSMIAASFSIENRSLSGAGLDAAGVRAAVGLGAADLDAQLAALTSGFNTTIATLATQTSFTLTVGPAEDDALNGCKVYFRDAASAVQVGYAVVLDYTGSTKTVTLVAGTTFTVAATDNVSFFPPTDAQTIIDGIVAQVATAQDLVDAMDTSSEKLGEIRESNANVEDKMNALVLGESQIIGATGNDTTHLHLPGLGAYADDAINNMLVTIVDLSLDLKYSRWIEGFDTSTDLVTVALLPFTPEASVDEYTLTHMRRDVTITGHTPQTGDSFARIGAGGDGLTAITNRLSPLVTKTGLVVTDGGNSATSFKTNLTAITTNHYKDAFVRITSGSLIEQVKKCTGSTGTTDVVLQFASGFTGTPADSVTFEVIND